MLPVMQVGRVRPGAPPEHDVLHPVGGGLGQARPTNNIGMHGSAVRGCLSSPRPKVVPRPGLRPNPRHPSPGHPSQRSPTLTIRRLAPPPRTRIRSSACTIASISCPSSARC
ncbi:MAG: hypothetical protein FJ404_06695 [Verrucomicrobia bacterium]|nr:hypothetical protein [Verrucomicrobiota bacterium]